MGGSARDAVEQVRGWLNCVLRVTLADERVVEGKLECFDSLGNMILANAVQIPVPNSGRKPTRLGLVLAPGDAVVSVSVRNEVGSAARAIGDLTLRRDGAREAPSIL